MNAEEYGEIVGFLGMFFISTVILYFALTFLDKMPAGWGYFHILNLVFFIVLLGLLIKKILK